MASNNPLEYFERILNTPEIESYWDVAYMDYDTLRHFIVEIDSTKEVVMLDPHYSGFEDEESIPMTFQGLAMDTIGKYKTWAIGEVDRTMLHSTSLEVSNNYITRVLQILLVLINKMDGQFKGNPKLHFIKDALVSIQTELTSRYTTSTTPPTKSIKSEKSSSPLIWNAGPTILGTLFHELRHTYKTKEGKPFLDATPQQLEDFILAHFLDEEGNSFSQASIKTFLDPKKKKAKRDKVDLSKVASIAKGGKD